MRNADGETMARPPSTRVSLWPNFFHSLAAVLIGNAVYFLVLVPHLPAAGRHRIYSLDLGLFVDFWVCLVIYGLLALLRRKAAKLGGK
jgi:hypothetical protein